MFASRRYFNAYKRENYLDHQLAETKKELLKDCPSVRKDEKAKVIDEDHEGIKKIIFNS